MNKLILTAMALGLACKISAETVSTNYDSYGQLMLVKLDTAPFPHPSRAQGHVYHNQNYDAAGHYSDNTVGIFIPKGYHWGKKVDFIIHFHGWMNHVEKVFSDYNLITQFCASGRNAILIVPQGPHDAPDSFGGKLEDEGGFKRFMDDVLKTLSSTQGKGKLTAGNIVLSGHSGGYHVISGIVARGGMSANVREVWLYDALYGEAEKYMDWFNNFHGHRLIDIYTLHGGTKAESEKLMATIKSAKNPLPFFAKNETETKPSDLSNNRLLFIYSDLEHNEVIRKRDEFREYLKTSILKPLKISYQSPKALAD